MVSRIAHAFMDREEQAAFIQMSRLFIPICRVFLQGNVPYTGGRPPSWGLGAVMTHLGLVPQRDWHRHTDFALGAVIMHAAVIERFLTSLPSSIITPCLGRAGSVLFVVIICSAYV